MTTTNPVSQPCSYSIPVKIEAPEAGLQCELPAGHATNHRATITGYDGRKYVYYRRTARQEAERRELIGSIIAEVATGNDVVAYVTDITDPERSSIGHVVVSRGAL